MQEINCPECGKLFKIDEAGYSDLLKQVRDEEFKKELHERLVLAEKDKIKSIEIAQQELKLEIQKNKVAKDAELQRLQSKIKATQLEKELAILDTRQSVEKERDEIAYKLQQFKDNSEISQKLAIA